MCQRVVSDLGAVVTPWTRKKNVKQAEAVAALLEGQATSLRAVLSSAVSQSELLLQVRYPKGGQHHRARRSPFLGYTVTAHTAQAATALLAPLM